MRTIFCLQNPLFSASVWLKIWSPIIFQLFKRRNVEVEEATSSSDIDLNGHNGSFLNILPSMVSELMSDNPQSHIHATQLFRKLLSKGEIYFRLYWGTPPPITNFPSSSWLSIPSPTSLSPGLPLYRIMTNRFDKSWCDKSISPNMIMTPFFLSLLFV